MKQPILLSKLDIPRAHPHWIQRPRLIEHLESGLEKKVLLLSAPAGFGKTTLLSQWIRHRKLPAAWLSLDEQDNDPLRFLAYLVAALGQVPSAGDLLSDWVQPSQSSDLEAAAALLVAYLDRLEKDIFLVIDDYHLIQHRTIHHFLDFLLTHLSPHVHLILLSRSDPPLHLTRFRIQGELVEIRMDDLRFTVQETSEFFTHQIELPVPEHNAARLNTRTEGWAAGLQLAALSMKGQQDIDSFIQTFSGSNKYVLDYLLEEVFQGLPKSMQDFLMATSILPRFDSMLCDHVTGAMHSQEMIAQLEKNNLFIVPLDDRRAWYRYHALFSELLQKRLAAWGREAVCGFHRRAADWYEHHGYFDWAVDQFAKAGELDSAARLVDEQSEDLWVRGEHSTLSYWLELLPDEVFRARPRLAIYKGAMFFIGGDLSKAKTCLDDAQAMIAGKDRHLSGLLEGLRARLAFFRHDWEGMIRHAHQALAMLPEQDLVTRGAISIALGDAFMLKGDLAEAEAAFREAITKHRQLKNWFLVLATSSNLVSALVNQGKLHQAREACQHYLALASDAGLAESVWTSSLYAFLGLVHCEWHETHQALSYLYRGLQICEEHRNVLMQSICWFAWIKVEYCAGRVDEAAEALRELTLLAESHDLPRWVAQRIHAWKIRLQVPGVEYLGDVNALGNRLKSLRKEDFSLAISSIEEYLSVSRRILHDSENNNDSLIVFLKQLLDVTVDLNVPRLIIETALLLAVVHWKREENTEAFACLERALRLAERERFIQSFLNEGDEMARLLYRFVQEKRGQPFAGVVLEVFPRQRETVVAPEGYIEPLTEREAEVLQWIAAGKSNAEIAAALYVSIYTVKAHARNIYAKLLASSRTEAVSKARKFGIIK